MAYTFSEIGEILEKPIIGNHSPNATIEHLLFDSRQLLFPTNTLFFAIEGPKNDGHAYIPELYKQNVRFFVVENLPVPELFPSAHFIVVENSILALQRLATHHRGSKSLRTIGITGSNGKTICKEWLFTLLHHDYHVIKSPRSFNSQIGVPISIWPIKDDHDLGIFEAGISTVGEMEALVNIIQPEIGIFTHLGDAHSNGFKSIEEKLIEKLKLFLPAKTIIFSNNYPGIYSTIKKTYPTKELICWHFKENGPKEGWAIDLLHKEGRSILSLNDGKSIHKVNCPFDDRASVENLVNCILTMVHLDYDWQIINQRIQHLQPVNMRLELKQGLNGCQLINDSYTNDFSGLKSALDFANSNKIGDSFILVVSEILQSGMDVANRAQAIANLFNGYPLKEVLAVGESIKSIEKHFHGSKIIYFEDTAKLLSHFQEKEYNNETILFKGARKYQFDQIFNFLSRQIHNTILEIDLAALAHNIRIYASRLHHETKIMAMVKASAYGSGSIELARFLEARKIPQLAVAYADEGVTLRKAGIQIPIAVMNPENASFQKMIDFDLQPTIYDLKQLWAFQSLSWQSKQEIHLKLDTGMNRLGLKEDNLQDLLQELNTEKIRIASIFSHLSSSDDEREDSFTQSQIDTFVRMNNVIRNFLAYQPIRHILNSSGILRFPEFQFEMVRLGLGMYGIDTTNEVSDQLIKVHSLKARIAQIKDVQKGESIGYGRAFISERKMRIAILSLGYADGLMRLAGNEKFTVQLHNKKAPIVGNICMDMCMIDVTHIPLAKAGDEATIFGKQNDINILAKVCQTIPYEILTRISERVKRIYFEN